MKQPTICGIYMIEALTGNPERVGWKYIGQSVDCWARLDRHFRDLKRNAHKNPRVQAYFNKYGKNSLSFSILTICEKEKLNPMERWFIKAFDGIENGFNCLSGGQTTIQDKEFQKKNGSLQNTKTGEIVRFRGIEDFAKEHNLSSTHLSLVLSGKSKSIKGWVLPEEFKKLPSYFLKSPLGVVHCVRDFSIFFRENKIKNGTNIHAVINGRRNQCEGWTLQKETV